MRLALPPPPPELPLDCARMPARVTLCENPFNLMRDQRPLDLLDSETLGAALEREGLGDDFIFACNGEVLPPERAIAHIPQPGDDIALVPVLHNSTLRMVAMIGVAVAATAFAGPLGGVLAASFGSLSAATATAIAGSIISIGGSLLVTGIAALFMKKPAGNSYGVLGPSTTSRSGIPIPKGYGTMRMAGNITESWVDIMGNNEDQHDVDDGADTIGRQYVNCRIDFGYGPLLAFANMQLNGKDIGEYSDVAYAVLYGANNQTPVTSGDSRWVVLNRTTSGTTTNNTPTTAFDEMNNNYPQNQRVRCGVTQNFVIIEGQRNDTQKIGVYVNFPQGVWRYDDNMVIKRAAISYSVFYRTSATATSAPGAWIQIPPYWSTPNGETHYYYNIRQTILRQFTYADNLPPGRYDMMVQKYGSGAVNNPLDYFEHESNMWGDELWVESVQETSYTSLSYPNRIQVLLRFMATDQLSGSDVNLTIDGNFGLRSTLPAQLAPYATAAPNYGSDVPACVAYDIMTDDLIGANLPQDRIDLDFLQAWAALTETQVDNGDGGTQALAKFNGVFEQDGTTIWAALNMVAAMSRANLQRVGTMITGWLDQPDIPVQMFGGGNILLDSYTKEYLNLEDRSQEIEVTFADVADNYKTRNPVRVVFDQDETSDQALKKVQVNLLGCTNQVQAYYWGALKLNENELLIRSHTWKSNANAIRCRVGNIVLLSHDTPQWGYSGLLQPGSTATSLVLDRSDLSFAAGSGYNIVVIHPALQRMGITITAIVGSVLTVTGYDGTTPIKRLQQGSGSSLIDIGVTAVNSTTLLVGEEFPLTGLATGAATLWDLDVMETRTVTALKNDVATLSTALSAVPAAYAGFIYQSVTKVAIPVRIRTIKKAYGDQRYTIEAIDYSASGYTIPPPLPGLSYVPPSSGASGTNPVGDTSTAIITVEYIIA